MAQVGFIWSKKSFELQKQTLLSFFVSTKFLYLCTYCIFTILLIFIFCLFVHQYLSTWNKGIHFIETVIDRVFQSSYSSWATSVFYRFLEAHYQGLKRFQKCCDVSIIDFKELNTSWVGSHSEAALQRCSYKKVFRKYAVNVQENTHANVWFQ